MSQTQATQTNQEAFDLTAFSSHLTTATKPVQVEEENLANFFVQSGNIFQVKNKRSVTNHDRLPAQNFTIKMTPQGEFYLEQLEPFKRLPKTYGKTLAHGQRILNSYRAKDRNLGVMLAGTKGSGKTLLSREICISAAEVGIPTLIINMPFTGDDFYQFLSSIEQECVILLDEYEKVYDEKQQAAMLTLLDGVYQSKKLFLLTCNQKYKVDQNMRNRPGRIHYLIDFDGLDTSFIEEYCKDALNNKDRVQEVVNMCALFGTMNFDMLQAIVWEMNTYDEPVQRAITLLNVKPEDTYKETFTVKLTTKAGLDIDSKLLTETETSLNPTSFQYVVTIVDREAVERERAIYPEMVAKYKAYTDADPQLLGPAPYMRGQELYEGEEFDQYRSEQCNKKSIAFTHENMFEVDAKTRTYKYKNEQTGFILTLSKAPIKYSGVGYQYSQVF